MDYFELKNAFLERKNIRKARRELGKFLNKECGIVHKKYGEDLYMYNGTDDCYEFVTIDDIIIELAQIFDEDNLFSTQDVKTAVGFISERLTAKEMTENRR